MIKYFRTKLYASHQELNKAGVDAQQILTTHFNVCHVRKCLFLSC